MDTGKAVYVWDDRDCLKNKGKTVIRENSERFFQNRSCSFFPCHDIADDREFSCMFCYCPLYVLEDCGGDYTYTSKGIKDCSACLKPHTPEGYDHVNDKFSQIVDVEKKNRSMNKKVQSHK